MKQTLVILSSTALFTACSSVETYTPIVDGPPNAHFEHDLNACRSLAQTQNQMDDETMGAAVLGAGFGAAVGALDNDASIGGAALFGALTGGMASTIDVGERRQAIVRACLLGRGHPVVG